MRRVAAIAVFLLAGCSIFQGVDPRPLIASEGQKFELFMQMATSYEKLIAESNASAEVKAAYVAAISKARSQYQSMHAAGMTWISEAFSLNAKDMIDEILRLWKEHRE